MEIDEPESETAIISDVLRNLTAKGPLATSVAKLSGSSRIIPSAKDFHFYNNFNEFKRPVVQIDNKSKNLLRKIGASDKLFAKPMPLPDDKDVELDDDVAHDWLVNVEDEIIEMFDVSLDDFKTARKKEEESGVRTMRVDDKDEQNGFKMVYGKKDRKLLSGIEKNVEGVARGAEEVKVATKVKPKIPFHVPTITKPQEEYKIIVNNINQPFEHVWLQRSKDGSRFMHPLEMLSVMNFVDTSDSIAEPVKPLPLEATPFKLVEEVKDLKQLSIKLRGVGEFAVDLEHNQYRSFQGLTCLMQISTRTEDFVIDTLKLRVHIGPYLRDLFKDPSKRKVLHGADRDIVWLQRDFGIYICNMFDTGQASRVLKMERHSLEHLLNHFCGVKANKEYQNADWRIRPLPREMIKYAREDTHYLLYIYDLMRSRLLELPFDSDSSDPPLVEVYKRSYDICTQLYEKELLTDTSYLHIYGLVAAELTAQQLAVVSGLCEWRDVVARSEDESTGYVLPNRTLIEIAKQMPLTVNHLRRALKSKLPYIERNVGSVVSVIRHSIQNAAAFEEAVKSLEERRLELQSNGENALAPEDSDVLPPEASEISKITNEVKNKLSSSSPNDPVAKKKAIEGKADDFSAHKRAALPAHRDPNDTNLNSSSSAQATVQLLKKPNRAFGALLGNSTKRKFDPDKGEKEVAKLEQIKATVVLPFQPFSARDESPHSKVGGSLKMTEAAHEEDSPSAPPTGSSFADIIVLDDDSDDEPPPRTDNPTNQPPDNMEEEGTDSDIEKDEPVSLSDLSSSFEQCFPPLDQNRSSKVQEIPQPFLPNVQPFDYEAARKQVTFGVQRKAEGDESIRRRDKKKGSGANKESVSTEFQQGRRRQAFPASGNRSATFR